MGFYLLSYLCIAVFILATAYLVYRQITLPVHVRWELYPVQHETVARAAYGGSYLEEFNWWEKKQKRSLFNEIRYMLPEILLLRGLWKENRTLWRISFPFHFGLYLMIATFGLLLVNALVTLWSDHPAAPGGTIKTLLDGLIVVTGWTGLILGNIGSLGVFYKRLTEPELRDYSSFADYFNVLFIFLFFLSALVACLLGDPALEGAKAYTVGLLTGGHSADSLRTGSKHLRGGGHRVGFAPGRLYPSNAHVSYVHEVFPLSPGKMGRCPEPTRRIDRSRDHREPGAQTDLEGKARGSGWAEILARYRLFLPPRRRNETVPETLRHR